MYEIKIHAFGDQLPIDFEMVQGLLDRAARYETLYSVDIYAEKPEASGFTMYQMALQRNGLRNPIDRPDFVLGCVRRGPGQPLEFHS